MLFHLLGLRLTNGTSEDILVLLLGEVDIVVSVGVGELGGIVSIILIEGVGFESGTEFPGLELEISDGTFTVKIRNLHGSSVSFVVDNFSSGEPLLLLAETFEDMIGAHLHDAQLLVLASSSVLGLVSLASLELTDFTVAASWDLVGHKSHVLGVLHDGVAVTTLSGTEGSGFTVGDPVVMSLVVLVVLLEGIIQRTVQPVELGDATEIEGHLSVLVRLIVVSCSNRVDHFVHIGVDDGITPVVVSLLPIILGQVGRVEVNC